MTNGEGLRLPSHVPGTYLSFAPGPGGRKRANPVRTPKVAAVRDVERCFVRPGVLRVVRTP